MDEIGFTLLRPWWLLALPISWFIWVNLPSTKEIGSVWDQLISSNLKKVMLIQTESKRPRYPWLAKTLLTLGWCIGILALTGPSCSRSPNNLAEKSSAQVLVIDLSASMLAQDIKPSRIQRVHFKIRDIMQQFPERHTGMVVYAGSAHVALPITSDPDNLINMLDTLFPEIMPLAGNRLDLGIMAAGELFKNAGWSHGDILVFTDDIEATTLTELDDWIKDNRHNVAVFGVGTEQGAPIPLTEGVYIKDANNQIIISQTSFGQLQQATASLGGRFSPMTVDDRDIRSLGLDAERRHTQLESTEKETDRWQDQGYWLVLPLLLMSLAAFRKGWAGCIVAPIALLALPSPTVNAEDTSPSVEIPLEASPTKSSEPLDLPNIAKKQWWLNDDQNAYRMLQQAPAKAAELFKDPNWQATAHYRAGNYPEAAKRFGQLGTAGGDYNQGNAYLSMQDYVNAMASYKRALEKDPSLTDAEHNLKLAQALLEQQQQNQDQNQQGQQQGNRDQNQQGQPQQNQGQHQQDQQQAPRFNGQSGQPQRNQQPPKHKQPGQQPNPKQNPKQYGDQHQAQHQDDQRSPTPYNPNTQALNAVPDDPGGLFRNKFRREVEKNPPEPLGGKSW